jgi:hypothetical protein
VGRTLLSAAFDSTLRTGCPTSCAEVVEGLAAVARREDFDSGIYLHNFLYLYPKVFISGSLRLERYAGVWPKS